MELYAHIGFYKKPSGCLKRGDKKKIIFSKTIVFSKFFSLHCYCYFFSPLLLLLQILAHYISHHQPHCFFFFLDLLYICGQSLLKAKLFHNERKGFVLYLYLLFWVNLGHGLGPMGK